MVLNYTYKEDELPIILPKAETHIKVSIYMGGEIGLVHNYT